MALYPLKLSAVLLVDTKSRLRVLLVELIVKGEIRPPQILVITCDCRMNPSLTWTENERIIRMLKEYIYM